MIASRRTAAAVAQRCPSRARPWSIRKATPQDSSSPSMVPYQRRNFSMDSLITSAADSIASIHNAGVPWYITIPLVAVGVNITLRLPLQYYNRQLDLKRGKLQPLVRAWMSRHSLRLARQTKIPTDERALEVLTLTEKSAKRLAQRWGVQYWKNYLPLLTVAPFATISLALRQLSGIYRVSGSEPMQIELLEETITETGSKIVEAAQAAPPSLMDPSLTTGGLFWFTDLTVADPYMLLPILCSCVLFYNSVWRMSREQWVVLFAPGSVKRIKTPAQRVRIGLARGTVIIPLFPLVFASMPAAIYLYWLSTFALNGLNSEWLKRHLPRTPSHLHVRNETLAMVPYLIGKRLPARRLEDPATPTTKKL